MKQFMPYLALAGIAAVLLAGCSDDTVSNPPAQTDSTYVRFAAKDKFTYNYYPHDVNNNRDNSGKLVKVWTVLNVNQAIAGRTGVALVEESTFQADGVTPVGTPDTFDFHSSTDGKFSQYNLLTAVVKRIPNATAFLDIVPPKWIQIGDTKTATATTWDGIEGGPIVDSVVILGSETTVKLNWNALHAGKQSVTVPDSTFAKAFHTDHQVIISANSPIFNNTMDTVKLSYDITANEGIVRQSLDSKIFSATGQQIPGFDMELVSITRAK